MSKIKSLCSEWIPAFAGMTRGRAPFIILLLLLLLLLPFLSPSFAETIKVPDLLDTTENIKFLDVMKRDPSKISLKNKPVESPLDISTKAPATLSGDQKSFNDFKLLVGGSVFEYQFYLGRIIEDKHYSLDIRRTQRIYGLARNRADRDSLSGSIATDLLSRPFDLTASYRQLNAEIPGNRRTNHESQQMSMDLRSTSTKDDWDFLSKVSYTNESVSSNAVNLVNASSLAKYHFNNSPVIAELEVGRRLYRSIDLKYYIPGINAETSLSSATRMALGFSVPVYTDSRHVYKGLLPLLKITQNLDNNKTAWVAYTPCMKMPQEDTYFESEYRAQPRAIVPEHRYFQLEVGAGIKLAVETDLTVKLEIGAADHYLASCDINNDKLVEYINLGKVNLFSLQAEARHKLASNVELKGACGIYQAEPLSGSGSRVPYYPGVKGSMSLAIALSRTINWQLSALFSGRQYTSLTSGNLPGYLTFDTRLEKAFSEDSKGYVTIMNLLDERYDIYKDIPGQLFTIAVGMELSL